MATKKKTTPEQDLAEFLACIEVMQEPDRTMANRIYELAQEAAPALAPRVWYGMPGFTIDGNIVCFFQSALKYKTKYCTLGFQKFANLDDGDMWPMAYAIRQLTPAVEAEVSGLLRKAVAA